MRCRTRLSQRSGAGVGSFCRLRTTLAAAQQSIVFPANPSLHSHAAMSSPALSLIIATPRRNSASAVHSGLGLTKLRSKSEHLTKADA